MYVPNLPIPPETYRHNTDTLKAMLIDYFENQVADMFQQVDKMEQEKSVKMAQVISIHFGNMSHSMIRYFI